MELFFIFSQKSIALLETGNVAGLAVSMCYGVDFVAEVKTLEVSPVAVEMSVAGGCRESSVVWWKRRCSC